MGDSRPKSGALVTLGVRGKYGGRAGAQDSLGFEIMGKGSNSTSAVFKSEPRRAAPNKTAVYILDSSSEGRPADAAGLLTGSLGHEPLLRVSGLTGSSAPPALLSSPSLARGRPVSATAVLQGGSTTTARPQPPACARAYSSSTGDGAPAMRPRPISAPGGSSGLHSTASLSPQPPPEGPLASMHTLSDMRLHDRSSSCSGAGPLSTPGSRITSSHRPLTPFLRSPTFPAGGSLSVGPSAVATSTAQLAAAAAAASSSAASSSSSGVRWASLRAAGQGGGSSSRGSSMDGSGSGAASSAAATAAGRQQPQMSPPQSQSGGMRRPCNGGPAASTSGRPEAISSADVLSRMFEHLTAAKTQASLQGQGQGQGPLAGGARTSVTQSSSVGGASTRPSQLHRQAGAASSASVAGAGVMLVDAPPPTVSPHHSSVPQPPCSSTPGSAVAAMSAVLRPAAPTAGSSSTAAAHQHQHRSPSPPVMPWPLSTSGAQPPAAASAVHSERTSSGGGAFVSAGAVPAGTAAGGSAGGLCVRSSSPRIRGLSTGGGTAAGSAAEAVMRLSLSGSLREPEPATTMAPSTSTTAAPGALAATAVPTMGGSSHGRLTEALEAGADADHPAEAPGLELASSTAAPVDGAVVLHAPGTSRASTASVVRGSLSVQLQQEGPLDTPRVHEAPSPTAAEGATTSRCAGSSGGSPGISPTSSCRFSRQHQLTLDLTKIRNPLDGISLAGVAGGAAPGAAHTTHSQRVTEPQQQQRHRSSGDGGGKGSSASHSSVAPRPHASTSVMHDLLYEASRAASGFGMGSSWVASLLAMRPGRPSL